MTKISDQIRESITLECVDKQFAERLAKMRKEESKLGIEMYNVLFDSAMRKKLNSLPEMWFRMDSCLRFNCGGYDVRFNVEKAVRVPHSTHCERLGNITGEIADRAQAFVQEREKMKELHKEAYRSLLTMLSRFTSFKQLSKDWPEGRVFYEKYLGDDSRLLPVVQVQEVNKLLGLGS